ncbi:hypothetical protein JW859_09460 [bacterium]|nr:hypothetical protein [bacterium]
MPSFKPLISLSIAAFFLVLPATSQAVVPVDARSATTLSIDNDTATLSWGYYMSGDYNQDSYVTVNDLTPLGQNFLAPGPFDQASALSVVDGNQDGEINVSDITPIGQNFGAHVHNYNIYTAADASAWPDGGTFVFEIEFNQSTGEPAEQRRQFSHTLSEPIAGNYYWVRPDDSLQDGIASNYVQYEETAPNQSGRVDLRLASDGAGTGGTLAVRIFAPDAGGEHFPDGAPVVVHVPGGTSSGSIRTGHEAGLEDYIEISFSMPGSGAVDEHSDGVFDDRGPLCHAALRDVLRYALGQTADTDGWTLDQRLAATPLYDNVGVLAGSNGGPLSVVTFARHGTEFSELAWYVGFENPTCGQCVMPDAGPGDNEVGLLGPEHQITRFINPTYTGPQLTSLILDYSGLAYDEYPPDDGTEMIYLERGGLARFDTVAIATGGFTSDLNGNGVIDATEDWGFGFWLSDGLRYYSQPVIEAIWDQEVFPSSSEPAWLPTVAQAEDFWYERDATLNYAAAAANLSQLKAIQLARVVDHVQAAPDKPHVYQAYHGWHGNGVWVKLNPAADSLIAFEPVLAGRTDLPSLPANTEPADWSVLDYCVPNDVGHLSAAGVVEITELIHAE